MKILKNLLVTQKHFFKHNYCYKFSSCELKLVYFPTIHLRTPANILKERPKGNFKKSVNFTSLTLGDTSKKFGSLG